MNPTHFVFARRGASPPFLAGELFVTPEALLKDALVGWRGENAGFEAALLLAVAVAASLDAE